MEMYTKGFTGYQPNNRLDIYIVPYQGRKNTERDEGERKKRGKKKGRAKMKKSEEVEEETEADGWYVLRMVWGNTASIRDRAGLREAGIGSANNTEMTSPVTVSAATILALDISTPPGSRFGHQHFSGLEYPATGDKEGRKMISSSSSIRHSIITRKRLSRCF
ncbi:hypothetical protein BDBG_01741 [Blastomyces gilchristii SLH14081]|uniref:Uncharacterized protein n=1 Tax=Blastomyces gilchristii (strain SLH14081) TaxID=559298 RepID=A0A179UBJ8_BLAGS|nr:uncharacterized protein BDBG_01741 [Blastomyces gilchristii SLH14081]OAT05324.1 hypothetical protein BDBG_01741 [Blastomyces gilchristii SLH14081]